MSVLPLFSLLLFNLSPLVLFFCLSVFFRFFRHFIFYFACSWIVSSFSLSITFLHNFLNFCKLLLSFLFLFCHQKKKRFCLFALVVGHVLHFFLFCLVFSVLNNGFSSFRIFCLPVVMYLKKMLSFIQQIGEDIFCFFSFCHVSFFFSSLVFLFWKKVCEMNLFSFELFFEIPCSSFFSLHFSYEKIRPTKKSSLLFSPFFVSLFLSTFFLSSFFFDNFSFHLFCSSLFAFSSFFLFSPFSPLFLHFSISVFLFLLFLYLMFPYLFSTSPFLRIPLFDISHSSSLHFDLDLFVFLLFLYPVQYFLWSIFLKRRKCFFEPSRYLNFFSCVFLLASSFFLVRPMFSVFRDSSLLLILIFFYQSSFWASSKKRFVFERNQIIIDSFLNIILFDNPFFPDFPLFAVKVSPMHDLQKLFCHLFVFSSTF